MADSSLVEISFVEESTFGTVPNSAFTKIRHTGGSFGVSTNTTRSNEVRGDAQRGGTVRTGFESSATLNIELSGQTFDTFIKQLMRSTWSTAASVSASDISADKANNKFVSSSAVDFTTTNIDKGQWVYIDGFADTSINGWYKASDVGQSNAGELVVANNVPADETAGNTITMDGSYIRNGTNKPSMALQLEHLDLSSKFKLITGARIGQWSLDFSTDSIITGSFQFQGKSFETKSSKSGDGTVNDAPSTEAFNAIDHVTGIFIDDTLVSGESSSFSFQANMNPRRLNSLGNLEAFDIGLGSMDVTGSLQFFLDDDTWSRLQDYVDFTKFGLAVALDNGNGEGYVIEFPQVALTNEPGNVPGPDDDVTLQFDFSAEPGESYDKTMQVTRLNSS